MITDESGQSAGFEPTHTEDKGAAERGPFTLDDVSQRINAICSDYLEAVNVTKINYEKSLNALSAAIDAAPDLDKDAVGSIVLGRVKKMLVDVAQAI